MFRIIAMAFCFCLATAATVNDDSLDTSSTYDPIADIHNEIRENFFNLFGMGHPPAQPARPDCIPPLMRDIYRQGHDSDAKCAQATIVHGLLSRIGKNKTINFNLTTVSKNPVFIHSKLMILYRPQMAKADAPKQFTVRVKVNGTVVASRFINTTNSHEDEWIKFNVRKIAKEYVKAGKDTISFHVTAVGPEGEIRPHSVGLSMGLSHHCSRHPFLVVYQKESSSKRRRRDVAATAARIHDLFSQLHDMTEEAAEMAALDMEDDFDSARAKRSATAGEHVVGAPVAGSAEPTAAVESSSPSRRGQCRVKALNLTFSALGWHHIIAPAAFNGGVCRGECKFPLKNVDHTPHGLLQAAMHKANPDKVPKVSCSPSQFDGVSLLFSDGTDSTTYKKYPNSVVTRCGCR